jgi:hypothetical protein
MNGTVPKVVSAAGLGIDFLTCATFQQMNSVKFSFAYFWFSSASGGRETFA